MDASGQKVTQLTDNDRDDFAPAWSPDGRHIAFTSDHSGNCEVWVVNADGTGLARLTEHPIDDFGPSYAQYRGTSTGLEEPSRAERHCDTGMNRDARRQRRGQE